MKRAALGVRMHSGWGVLVAISGDADSTEIVDRRRIVVTDAKHFRGQAALSLCGRARASESPRNILPIVPRSPSAWLSQLSKAWSGNWRGAIIMWWVPPYFWHRVRSLPCLSNILASHPLIHTAEGEFFRDAVKKACERLEIPVTAIRERDVDEQAKQTFGNTTNRMQRKISGLGKFYRSTLDQGSQNCGTGRRHNPFTRADFFVPGTLRREDYAGKG